MADFADPKDFPERYESIAETGAKHGDTVICCSIRDNAAAGVRYTEGRKYSVVSFCGSVGIKANSHGIKVAGDTKWLIPF